MSRSQDCLCGNPDFAAVAKFDAALKRDRIGAFRAVKLPRVCVGQPIIGLFALFTADKALAKQAIFIANAIAIGRATDGGHRFHETRRQPAQSAIAKCGIGLVLYQGTEVLAKALHHLDRNFAQA